MPRIRTVKPEFFFDEDLAKLDPMTRLFFIGIWTQADKAGKLEDRPERLKANIFPYEKFNAETALQKLEKHFIIRYQVEGKKYIKINSFLKHQRPHHTEVNSTIPEPNGEIPVKERLETAGEGNGEGNGEGKGKEYPPNPPKGDGAEQPAPVAGKTELSENNGQTPLGDAVKPYPDPKTLPPVGKVVYIWKVLAAESPPDDRGWDKRNWSRASKSAKVLLEYHGGDVRKTVRYMQSFAKEYKEKSLSFTLETMVKNFDMFMSSRRPKDAEVLSA